MRLLLQNVKGLTFLGHTVLLTLTLTLTVRCQHCSSSLFSYVSDMQDRTVSPLSITVILPVDDNGKPVAYPPLSVSRSLSYSHTTRPIIAFYRATLCQCGMCHVLCLSGCVCVCHMREFCQIGSTDRAGFGMEASFHLCYTVL